MKKTVQSKRQSSKRKVNKLKVCIWFGRGLFFGTIPVQIGIFLFLKDNPNQAIFGMISMYALALVGFATWMVARDKVFTQKNGDGF
jgi:hypothetical protein